MIKDQSGFQGTHPRKTAPGPKRITGV